MEASSRPAKSGYIAKFDLAQFPVFIHWTFPFTGLLLTLFLGNFSLVTFLSVLSAYVCLVLIHELGHAFFARLARRKVHAITVTGLGGWCVIDTPETFRSQLLFYSGGLLFQLVALAVTALLLVILGNPRSAWLNSFAFVFTFYNALMFALNAMPIGKTDGAKIWALVRSR